MSVIKFELKQEHIDLLSAMNWSQHLGKFVISAEDITEDASPFGGDNLYDDMDLILNGKPLNFDPFAPVDLEKVKYTPEQIATWDKLLSELPEALDIILKTKTFSIGHYRTRYHEKSWRKMPPITS